MLKPSHVESTAEAYLELLAARRRRVLLRERRHRLRPSSRRSPSARPPGVVPRPLTVPHEVPAVAMAHGYAWSRDAPRP